MQINVIQAVHLTQCVLSVVFFSVQLLAPDIRHERNVLLQCVRYVVRNSFFGLESRSQLQEAIRDATTKQEERPSEEVRAAAHSDASGREESRFTTTKAAGVEQHLPQSSVYGLDNCQDFSGQSEDPPADSAAAGGEQVSSDFMKNSEENGHILDLKTPGQVTLNVYDDEIWESAGAAL